MPAYNAGRTLAAVIQRLPTALPDSLDGIYIVNDGSSDDTGTVAEYLAARQRFIRVIHLERNRGYGGAVKCGLSAALDDGAEVIACLHADGQYAPESLPALLEARRRLQLDILQGSRLAGGGALSGGMPLYKYVAGRLLTALENAVFDMRMTDYHSGCMLYGREALRLQDRLDALRPRQGPARDEGHRLREARDRPADGPDGPGVEGLVQKIAHRGGLPEEGVAAGREGRRMSRQAFGARAVRPPGRHRGLNGCW